jgi:hypothetical protein
MTGGAITVEDAGPQRWRIRVERQMQQASATGEVVVRQEDKPDDAAPPLLELAAGRAWLALAQQQVIAGHAATAISAARAGLDEVGSAYKPLTAKDDTTLKVLAAEDGIQQGHEQEGADALIEVLRQRLESYAEQHTASVAE